MWRCGLGREHCKSSRVRAESSARREREMSSDIWRALWRLDDTAPLELCMIVSSRQKKGIFGVGPETGQRRPASPSHASATRTRRPVALSPLHSHDDYYLTKTMRLYGGRLGRRASRGIGLTARLCRNSWRRHFSTCTCTVHTRAAWHKRPRVNWQLPRQGAPRPQRRTSPAQRGAACADQAPEGGRRRS